MKRICRHQEILQHHIVQEVGFEGQEVQGAPVPVTKDGLPCSYMKAS